MGITIESIEELARDLIAGKGGRYHRLQFVEDDLLEEANYKSDKFLEAIDESVRRQSDDRYGVAETEQCRFAIEVFGPARYLRIFEIDDPRQDRLFILAGPDAFFCEEVIR